MIGIGLLLGRVDHMEAIESETLVEPPQRLVEIGGDIGDLVMTQAGEGQHAGSFRDSFGRAATALSRRRARIGVLSSLPGR